jgi:predicted permease
MNTLGKDLKFGARALMRMPGSALISVIVLAIGIGLCSFMFSLVYGIYFRGMDIPESDRFFVVFETNVERDQLSRSIPILDFIDFGERQRSFEGLLATRSGTVNLSGPESPMRFEGAFVTANAFSVLRVQPVIGRGFGDGDDAPGAPPNVVLGYKAWMDRFGGDRSILGQDVRVNGEPATILGVMPEGFEFPNNTEVWVPLTDDPLSFERAQGYVQVFGRLADGVTRDRAEAELASIARQLEQEHPESNEGIGAQLDTMVEANMNTQLNMVFGAMMVAVLCVLLVACANVANLLLARAAMRTKEAGVRVALGGSRLRVMLPFFAEAFVLASVGALLGIGITYVCVGWFDAMSDPARTGRPWFMQFTVDLPILGFIVLLTGLTALVAGIAPALKMSRTDVNAVLKDEARGSSSLHIGRVTKVLVTAEVALSCALLVGAGLMAKSIVNLGGADYAYETESVFTARVGLFEADYPDRDARQQLWSDLVDELRGVPRVASAAVTTSLPHQGGAERSIAMDGRAYDEGVDLPSVSRIVVSTGYFETFGVSLLDGRDFTEADDAGSELVAIVNQPMVERYFDGQNPIGRRFREGVSDTLPLITVVGVVPDLSVAGSTPPGLPDYEPGGYYVPLRQHDASFMSIAVMPHGGEALAVTADVRGAVRRIDGDLPIYNVYSQAEVVDRSTWFFGLFGTVFIVFGAAALFMASVGLYGVLSFGVTRRTQEMGIRMALGAGSRDVIGLVARQGAGQLAIGLGIGFVLAFGVTRVVSFLMYDVDPQDPTVFGAVLGLIVLVGMAAAVFPAWRATSVSPVEALRSE